jgi:hypothetical protein
MLCKTLSDDRSVRDFSVLLNIFFGMSIQGVHKRMVQFQNLTRNLFLTLHRHNVHRQQRQLSKFLAVGFSWLLRGHGARFQDGVAAGKGVLCAPFWGVQICDYSTCATITSKPCTKLTLHCNHRSWHLKTEHTERLFLLRRHLGIWPRGPAVTMKSQLLET